MHKANNQVNLECALLILNDNMFLYREYTPGKRSPALKMASLSYSTQSLTGLLGSGITDSFTTGPDIVLFLLKDPLNSSSWSPLQIANQKKKFF